LIRSRGAFGSVRLSASWQHPPRRPLISDSSALARTPPMMRGLALVTVLVIVAGCGSSEQTASSLAPAHGTYSPSIHAGSLGSPGVKPVRPLNRGSGYHYSGVRGPTPQTDDEIVLQRQKRILSIAATVVRATVSEHGRPIERTPDYYAQDKQGNVWYLG